jgi:molybdopterin converting factor small subunit
VKVRLLLFAGLRERAGEGALDLDDLPAGATVDQVVARARARVPGLDQVQFAVARNRSIVRAIDRAKTRVDEGDEVALLPPVSGG